MRINMLYLEGPKREKLLSLYKGEKSSRWAIPSSLYLITDDDHLFPRGQNQKNR